MRWNASPRQTTHEMLATGLEISPAAYLEPHLLKALQVEDAPSIASYLAFEVLWLRKDMFELEVARRERQRAEMPRQVVVRGGERPMIIPRAAARKMLDFQQRHQVPGVTRLVSPVFSEESSFLIDGQLHSSAQYTQFRLFPAPYVSLQALYRSHNMETGETTDTEFLAILVDRDSGSSTAVESGKELQTDEEMLFPLSVVLSARRAVAAERLQT